jgi:predicted transcriptional regulator
MHAADFERLLDTADDIVEHIENGTILQHPAAIRGSVARTATNRQALRRMDALNLSELAVLDEADRFAGTITQDEIVRKILANVIRES